MPVMKKSNFQMEGRTERQTDGRKHRRTDGRTDIDSNRIQIIGKYY